MAKQIRKIMRLTSDTQRIRFFAWSHLTGWILANIQTILIMIQIHLIYKKIMEAIKNEQ